MCVCVCARMRVCACVRACVSACMQTRVLLLTTNPRSLLSALLLDLGSSKPSSTEAERGVRSLLRLCCPLLEYGDAPLGESAGLLIELLKKRFILAGICRPRACPSLSTEPGTRLAVAPM